MKSVTWQGALVGLWVAAFAAAVVWRAGGRWGESAPPPVCVELIGPNVELLERLASKRRLSHEVIAGRLSLFQAAAAFRDVDAQTGGKRGAFSVAFPGCTSEEEAYCRAVIALVGTEAPRDQAEDLTCALQAELEDRLADGDMQLPDSPAR